MGVFNNFIKDFKEDEKALEDSSAWDTAISEKQRDIDKREKEELKRLEKAVFKKDAQEVEEIYSNAIANSNPRVLRDRIAKTINDHIAKQLKVMAKA